MALSRFGNMVRCSTGVGLSSGSHITLGAIMRSRVIAAILLAACLPLTACGGGDEADGKKSSSRKADTPPQEPAAGEVKDLALGKPATTIGSPSPAEGPGGGVLEITPSTVVYVTEGMGEEPANDTFAVVAYKARSTKPVAAAETAPVDGGGWQWVASDGQAVDTLSGNGSSVTPDGFSGGGPVTPGSFQWRTQVFDLSEAQQGGTLSYSDGEGNGFRWKMPKQDTGPEVAKLKKALAW